ncbi:Protein quiver [Gryllus bimaculatus]|nr:Protein quiver [Gryllus bimaculatus]
MEIVGQVALALHCWVCRSDNEPRCADPFDNATLSATNCSHVPLRDGEARFCSKMRSEVNGKTVYFRGCSDKEGLCPNVEHPGLCSTCKKDYCNGAERPGGDAAPRVAVVAAALVALAARLAPGGGPP